MKKAICIFIVLISSFSYSQTKQNDATWEETIAFIKKYSRHLEGPQSEGERIENFNIDSKTIRFKWINRHNHSWYKGIETVVVSAPLLKLMKVSKGESGLYIIYIWLTGNYVSRNGESVDLRKNKRSKISFKTSVFKFAIKDVEMRDRMFKAFKHLTYLAKQERLKQNKGDKF